MGKAGCASGWRRPRCLICRISMLPARPNSLILLPGMMCDDRLFATQITRLCHEFEDKVEVIVPVLDTADTIKGLAHNIIAEAPASFALAGLSMGGIVAMEILAQAPERINRLALMDTNPLAETNEGLVRRDRQIQDVQNGLLKQGIMDEMKPLYLAENPHKQAILDLCMDMALSLGEVVFIRQSCALRDRPDQTATLAPAHCPTLILYGAEDRLCPPERHYLMKQLIPHATLAEIEGAGHLPPLEAPEASYDHLRAWLNQDS